jgi:hypothetical protein
LGNAALKTGKKSGARESATNDTPETNQSSPPPTGAASSAGAPSRAPATSIHLDDLKAVASYANVCRVTGTPEELIIDFAMNPQSMGVPSHPLAVSQRIILNQFTAKRLLHALNATLNRHEAVFGVLETNVQKRVVPSLRTA